ncbi:MAG: hypothetical protein LBQ66_06825, partial [Planctomycetaceae bacterium]|nr:hypothetical protein [Planctomycetaceae bacterium]
KIDYGTVESVTDYGVIKNAGYTVETKAVHSLTQEQLEAIAIQPAQKYKETDSRVVPVMLDLFKEESIQYTGGKYKDREFKYRLHVPENLDKNKKYPLILWLHGVGEIGDDNKLQLVHLHHIITYLTGEKKRDFFLLVPQTPTGETTWGSGVIGGGITLSEEQTKEFLNNPVKFEQYKDELSKSASADGQYREIKTNVVDGKIELQFVTPIEATPYGYALAMIEQVRKKYPIDKDRITVSGLSSGGDGTWRILELKPDLFAAAVPLVSWNALTDEAIKASPILKKIPIWALYSSDDRGIDFARSEFDRVEKAGCNVKKSEFGICGHNAWTPAMLQADIFSWLLSRSKKGGKYVAVVDANVNPDELQGIVEVATKDPRKPTLAPEPPASVSKQPATTATPAKLITVQPIQPIPHKIEERVVATRTTSRAEQSRANERGRVEQSLANERGRAEQSRANERGRVEQSRANERGRVEQSRANELSRDELRRDIERIREIERRRTNVEITEPKRSTPNVNIPTPNVNITNTIRTQEELDQRIKNLDVPPEVIDVWSDDFYTTLAWQFLIQGHGQPTAEHIKGFERNVKKLSTLARLKFLLRIRNDTDKGWRNMMNSGDGNFFILNMPLEVLQSIERMADETIHEQRTRQPATKPRVPKTPPPPKPISKEQRKPVDEVVQESVEIVTQVDGEDVTVLGKVIEDCDRIWAMTSDSMYGMFPADWGQEAENIPEFIVNLDSDALSQHLARSISGNGQDFALACKSIIALTNKPMSSPWFETKGGRLRSDISYSLSPKGKMFVRLLKAVKETKPNNSDKTTKLANLAGKTLEKINLILK